MADEASDTNEAGDSGRERSSDPSWGSNADPSTSEDERIPMNLSRDDSADSDRSATDDESESDPYAPEPGSARVEAGDPDLENVLFVLLGAIAMLLAIAHVVSLPL
ncbi:DUF7312 domain-containing protein [Natronobacterium texcoconense]|uniref:DUF7312 domain-containing protein n=1 Tax=Natronobacterium texcoconense TaxID=1095778 RepID=A0A1H1BQP7_NATTX|nr:hypothetical protein [Natronobacterium texcoconense]SDQ54219.1 hypothetical protein SAMN04489842_1119 [Natronobacterium texcoconense]